jgi:hypothetical protein
MSETTPNQGFGISADDLRSYDWQVELAAATCRECYAFHDAFTVKVKALSDAGDARGASVFRLLTAVAGFWPNYDDDAKPFHPTIVDYQTGKRFLLMPEDLAKPDFEALTGILDEIKDPEFRARVADVLWVNRRDYKAAQKAVEAYIESSRVLETGDMWPPFAERLRRAMQVGAKLGWSKLFHQKAVAAVEDAITRHEATENGLLCARLMLLLLADQVGDPKRYASLAEMLAKRMETVPNWSFARDYWQLKAAWDSKDGNEENVRADHLLIAKTYIKIAEGFTTAAQPSFLGASHWMAKAVHTLREAKADPADIQKAHSQLLEFEQRGMGEMETIQIPLESGSELESNLEKAAKAAAAHVAGHFFEDAILRLAFVAEPTNPTELRKRIEQPNFSGAFSSLFASTTVRPDGKITDSKPPIASDDPKQREEAILKEMYLLARTIDWKTRVQVFIEPARRQIINEHPARQIDLLFLVQDNPFVPRGREGLFLRGLHAGLHGDLVLAIHLLLPQIENSLREIFAAKGLITSKLESDDTQDERDLGWLLTHSELARIFGEGVAFDLRGLLVERFGLNLRNDIAHGLLAESQMITEGALYAWWLTLRLCCFPIAAAKRESKS